MGMCPGNVLGSICQKCWHNGLCFPGAGISESAYSPEGPIQHKMLGPTTRDSDPAGAGAHGSAFTRSLVPAALRIALWNAGRGHASEGN